MMHYGLTSSLTLNQNQCLVLGICSDLPLSEAILNLDKTCNNLITQLAERAKEPGDMIWQTEVHGASLLIVQCGPSKKYNPTQLKKRLGDITDTLIKNRYNQATLCMPLLSQQSPGWQIEQMLLQIDYQNYQLLDFKKKNPKANTLESIQFFLPGAHDNDIQHAKAIAEGIELTRNLGNLPANICTPSYLADEAERLARTNPKLSCKVMGAAEMKEMGMGTLLAVAQGSHEPPKLIEIHYKGDQSNKPPIVLVGKGVTFDSGGLSLKPANNMDEMKYDMCGAASVLGTIKACALLNLPINMTGIIPCTENMPGGKAVKPGDIVTSMSGQTVEIINTDAEGRLILADALTYAERFKPRFVIDIATLTGAMVVALGAVATGFMTNDDELASLIEAAAKISEDKAWRMPLDEDYQEAMDSPLADMLNATFDRSAGAITAACFLSRFTESFRWAHLDIAGTAWVSGKKRNATGRPVSLLTQLVRHVAHSN